MPRSGQDGHSMEMKFFSHYLAFTIIQGYPLVLDQIKIVFPTRIYCREFFIDKSRRKQLQIGVILTVECLPQ